VGLIKTAIDAGKGFAVGGPAGAAMGAAKTFLEKDPGKSSGGGGRKGPEFWRGPRAQAYSGAAFNYDWRPVEPLRPIYVNGKRSGGSSEGEEEQDADQGMFVHPLSEAFERSEERQGAVGLNGSYGTEKNNNPKRSGISGSPGMAGIRADLASAPGSVQAKFF
jgi:hypothetical protein